MEINPHQRSKKMINFEIVKIQRRNKNVYTQTTKI